jgi:hypothetical protein
MNASTSTDPRSVLPVRGVSIFGNSELRSLRFQNCSDEETSEETKSRSSLCLSALPAVGLAVSRGVGVAS